MTVQVDTRLSVRTTPVELERCREALTVARPGETVSGAVRAILDAIAASPRFAREVLADVLLPGCQRAGAARAEYLVACREDRDRAATSTKRGPCFDGDVLYQGAKDVGVHRPARDRHSPEEIAALRSQGALVAHPADRGHRNGSGGGPLAGQAGTGPRDFAGGIAAWYRHQADRIRAAHRKHAARRAEVLESALFGAIQEGERPVFVLVAGGLVLATADSRDDAERLAVATHPHLVDEAAGRWRGRLWLKLWEREGATAFNLAAARRRLLADGGAA